MYVRFQVTDHMLEEMKATMGGSELSLSYFMMKGYKVGRCRNLQNYYRPSPMCELI